MEDLTWEEISERLGKGEDFPENYVLRGPRFSDSAENIGILLALRKTNCLPKIIKGDRYFEERMKSFGEIFSGLNYVVSNEGILKPRRYLISKTSETLPFPRGEIDLRLLAQEYIKKENLWKNYDSSSKEVNLTNSEEWRGGDLSIPISNLLVLSQKIKRPLNINNAPKTLNNKIVDMGLEKILRCA